MSRITEKQLIESLNQLKEIKPRKEWVFSLKSQILSEPREVVRRADFMSTVSSVFFQKKFAYSFAVLLIMVAGICGFLSFSQVGPKNPPPQQTASLSNQSEAQKKVVAAINAKMKDLAQVLKNNPTQSPQTIKDIAVRLKTLADVPGTDLLASPDAQDLCKTVVANQILDLQKTTLTSDQQKILADTVQLYNTGKYTDALEKILLVK